MENSIFLIITPIIAIIIILSICFLITKYFLNPFFLKPKIKTSEIIKFLNKKKLIFIEYKALNRKEKQRNVFNQKKELTFDKIFSTKSEYKIIGFSQDENKYKIYWAEIKSWHRLFGKPNVNFIEGKDSKLLNELQKEYNHEIINVKDKCPACNNGLLKNETECKNCGLNLVAE
jgi:hypothetical protein